MLWKDKDKLSSRVALVKRWHKARHKSWVTTIVGKKTLVRDDINQVLIFSYSYAMVPRAMAATAMLRNGEVDLVTKDPLVSDA